MDVVENLNEASPWLIGLAAACIITAVIGSGKWLIRRFAPGSEIFWDIWTKQAPVYIGALVGLLPLPSPDGLPPWAFYALAGVVARLGVYELLFQLFPKTKAKVKDSLRPGPHGD